jgi:hypothetical protein
MILKSYGNKKPKLIDLCARNKAAYSYMLTPQGIEERSLMLVQFLRRKKSEYQLLEQEIARLTQELDAHDTTELPDRS